MHAYVCFFSRLIGLFSVTGFLIYYMSLSDEVPAIETLEFTVRIGSAPTFLLFDLCTNAAHYVCFTIEY